MADYYKILGVDRDCDQDSIKKAYRKKARECHPDHHRDDPEKVEQFRQITEAYEVLSKPEARAEYDEFGRTGKQCQAILDELANMYINKVIQGTRDPIESLRNDLRKGINNSKENLKSTKRNITIVKDSVKKLKTKGSSKTLIDVIEKKIRGFAVEETMINNRIEDLEWRLEFLQNYDFENDGFPEDGVTRIRLSDLHSTMRGVW